MLKTLQYDDKKSEHKWPIIADKCMLERHSQTLTNGNTVTVT